MRRTSTPAEIERRFPNGPKRPDYEFKVMDELGWFVLVAVVSVVAQELLTFDGTSISDWRVWLIALLSAVVRAAAGALLAYFGKQAIGNR